MQNYKKSNSTYQVCFYLFCFVLFCFVLFYCTCIYIKNYYYYYYHYWEKSCTLKCIYTTSKAVSLLWK